MKRRDVGVRVKNLVRLQLLFALNFSLSNNIVVHQSQEQPVALQFAFDGIRFVNQFSRSIANSYETGTATPKSTATTPKKTGRGRPRKSLPTNGGLINSTTTTPKKDGRGRPRKSLPANGDAASDSPKPEPTTYSVPKEDTGRSYWLMKAEPESRLEKGVDVKFSIDDLADANEPEPWDGTIDLPI